MSASKETMRSPSPNTVAVVLANLHSSVGKSHPQMGHFTLLQRMEDAEKSQGMESDK